MHFCSICKNMYYIRINSDNPNKLVYYCRNCGNEDTSLVTDNVCVSKTQLKKSELSFSHIINKYTKLDPTLPRTTTIKCPNAECSSNKKDDEIYKQNEVIYIRYDDIHMKYIYICVNCDTMWKTDEQK